MRDPTKCPWWAAQTGVRTYGPGDGDANAAVAQHEPAVVHRGIGSQLGQSPCLLLMEPGIGTLSLGNQRKREAYMKISALKHVAAAIVLGGGVAACSNSGPSMAPSETRLSIADPVQAGQAPWGELKEKLRGSSSSMVVPS